MIHEDEPTPVDGLIESLLAFDRALIAGDDSFSTGDTASSGTLEAIHDCQRLLEAVWPRAAAGPEGLPARFGQFAVVRELGRGGFGVVFLAVDSRLGRQVALKVPRPEVLASSEARRRFLREAEAAARLD